MKNLFTILTAVFLITNTFLSSQAIAQSPEKMNYQAVIRDNNGHVITNQPIGMQISILQGSASGTAVYTETQLITSNANGLITTEIGTGTVVTGDFSTIDWSNGPYFLRIETDPTGGTNYVITGTNQLLSVPYAMHAKTADSLTDIDSFSWSTTGNAGTNDTINFIGTTDNQPLIFKVNNVQAGRIPREGGSNTFYGLAAGLYALGIWNTAIGHHALSHTNTGNYNTATGCFALNFNTTGAGNVAFGRSALYENATGNANSAIGDVALSDNVTGSYNTAIGNATLYNNATGSSNTATGYRALYNNTQSNNTANGFQALFSNTIGVVNTATGNEALYNNISGNHNTANGNKALYGNTSGHWNTANGSGALQNNTTGEMNTANGFTALYNNTDGNENTANGRTALFSNIGGHYNTATGKSALYYNTEGDYNTATGYKALLGNFSGNQRTGMGNSANSTGLSFINNTGLGYNADCSASNQVRIGNSSVSSIGGYANWSNVSDLSFKKNINEDVEGLAFINNLRPVTYNLDLHAIDDFFAEHYNERDSSNYDGKYDKENIRYTGFIAQEVEEAAQKIGYDFSGVDAPKNENDFYGLRYAEFVVPLVKGMQEQQKLIETLISENNQMKDELAQIKLLLNKNAQK
jgi:hypothetical protein